MGNLPLVHKFALIFVLSLTMVVLPATLAVRMQLETLDASRTEARGLAPAGAVLTLALAEPDAKAASELGPEAGQRQAARRRPRARSSS